MQVQKSQVTNFRGGVRLHGRFDRQEKQTIAGAIDAMAATAKRHKTDIDINKETDANYIAYTMVVSRESKTFLGRIKKFLTGETHHNALTPDRNSQFRGIDGALGFSVSAKIWRGVESVAKAVFGDKPKAVDYFAKKPGENKSTEIQSFLSARSESLSSGLRAELDKDSAAEASIKKARKGA